MVVTCPNCGSRYSVDPLAIGPAGRTVQCARCDHRWFQKVEGAAPLAGAAIPPATTAGTVAALPAVIPPRPGIAWPRLIAVAAAVVGLVGATLFAFRHEIATMVSYEARASTPTQVAAAPVPVPPAPAAAPAQADAPPRTTASTVGLGSGPSARPARPPQAVEAARPNIEVDLSSSKIEVVDGRYVVRGQLVNNGKAAGSTTLLHLTFKKDEDVLGERAVPMVEGPLPPGGRASFSQTLDDPPSGTTDIVPVVE